MSSEENMTIDKRYKYLRKMQKRRRPVNRQERSQLLDEMEAVTYLHRKSLVRLMKSKLERQPRLYLGPLALPGGRNASRPDNGREFFSHHLVRFFRTARPGVYLFRSQPYQKK